MKPLLVVLNCRLRCHGKEKLGSVCIQYTLTTASKNLPYRCIGLSTDGSICLCVMFHSNCCCCCNKAVGVQRTSLHMSIHNKERNVSQQQTGVCRHRHWDVAHANGCLSMSSQQNCSFTSCCMYVSSSTSCWSGSSSAGVPITGTVLCKASVDVSSLMAPAHMQT